MSVSYILGDARLSWGFQKVPPPQEPQQVGLAVPAHGGRGSISREQGGLAPLLAWSRLSLPPGPRGPRTLQSRITWDRGRVRVTSFPPTGRRGSHPRPRWPLRTVLSSKVALTLGLPLGGRGFPSSGAVRVDQGFLAEEKRGPGQALSGESGPPAGTEEVQFVPGPWRFIWVPRDSRLRLSGSAVCIQVT